MLTALAFVLLAAAAVGTVALALQLVLTRRHARESVPVPKNALPGISILKPLCGVDDDLEKNLACFAELDYPRYEIVLGVKNAADPAYAVARRALGRWPGVFRLVIQRGEADFNPKVNQLVTLEESARFDVLVISDSNTRVAPDYLREIAAHFEDPNVGCVSHPIVGVGEERLGALLDNLHLSASVGPGVVAAQRFAGKAVVVGKSMALRREDVAALGGFASMADYLAEDYVIGKAVVEQLGKTVAIAHGTVQNVSMRKSTRDFLKRYLRWSVIHRTAIEPSTFAAQAMLNPIPLAWIAAALHPTLAVIGAALAVTIVKSLVDFAAASTHRRFGMKALFAVPLKDALLFAAYLNAIFDSTVDWRGNSLRVTTGSKLVPLTAADEGEALEPGARAA